MKKNIYLLLFLMIGLTFTSCEEDAITIKEKVVLFASSSTSGGEDGGKIGIPVMNAGPDGGTTVSFEFVTEGYDNPAIEGVDFTLVNADKSITFDNNYGSDTIWIMPIDNDVYDKNKFFDIVLSSATGGYTPGVQSLNMVTIIDNEHPLALWIGSYTVDAASYGSPGAWDEVWYVTTSPNPDDETQLIFTGIAGSDSEIFATIDKDAMTVSFASGQELVGAYGYDAMIIYDGIYGVSISDNPLVGPILNDGTMNVDDWAHIQSPDGWMWDAFNCTFNMNKKKTTTSQFKFVDKSK